MNKVSMNVICIIFIFFHSISLLYATESSQTLTKESTDTTNIISGISAGAATLSMVLSAIALIMAGKASSTNKKMFKRQGVIDLHMAWHGVNEIDPKKLNTPDIVRAVNAIDLTAALWNHDVIEKTILYQSYWQPFKDIYETLTNCRESPPGISKRCCDLISREVVKAYEDMKSTDLNQVLQTNI